MLFPFFFLPPPEKTKKYEPWHGVAPSMSPEMIQLRQHYINNVDGICGILLIMCIIALFTPILFVLLHWLVGLTVLAIMAYIAFRLCKKCAKYARQVGQLDAFADVFNESYGENEWHEMFVAKEMINNLIEKGEK